VEQYKHLDASAALTSPADAILPRAAHIAKQYQLSDDGLEAIMLREFGPIRRKRYSEPKLTLATQNQKKTPKKPVAPPRHMHIIDGYNVIHSWDSLKELAKFNLEKARQTLIDILINFVAFTKTEVTLVFDAYLVKDGMGSEMTQGSIRIVYTKEQESADLYIETLLGQIGRNYRVRVATSDSMIQLSALRAGTLRVSARELLDEIERTNASIAQIIRNLKEESKRASIHETPLKKLNTLK
jgi:predicted RNA-binding protein with PIN domain